VPGLIRPEGEQQTKPYEKAKTMTAQLVTIELTGEDGQAFKLFEIPETGI
jgi:hypothetical protein